MNEHGKVVRIGEVRNAQVDIVDRTATVAEALKRIQRTVSHSLIISECNEDEEFGIVRLLCEQRMAKRARGVRVG